MTLSTLLFGMAAAVPGFVTLGPGGMVHVASAQITSAGGEDISAAALGWGDTVLGERAGASNATGNYNTFLGFEASRDNTEGECNTFCGFQPGIVNFSGKGNVWWYKDLFAHFLMDVILVDGGRQDSVSWPP